MNVLRATFANKNPLIAFHLLHTEIPYATLSSFLEYLDVYEELKDLAEKEAKEEAIRKQQQPQPRRGR